jgi:L-lactate dehydrogenase complex protein LldG
VNARDAILNQLRTAASPTLDADAARLLDTPERPAIDTADPIGAFLAKLALPSLGATHDRIDRMKAAPDAVRRYLDAHGLAPALYLPPSAALNALDWSGLAIDHNCAPDQAVAITVARVGVAETGSLVFETAPDAPMLPNFLCLHHIVLLTADSIVPYLEDAALPGPHPRAHYWITGVSGTTDIEGQYVRGAHGPRFLHVVLIGGQMVGPPGLEPGTSRLKVACSTN